MPGILYAHERNLFQVTAKFLEYVFRYWTNFELRIHRVPYNQTRNRVDSINKVCVFSLIECN